MKRKQEALFSEDEKNIYAQNRAARRIMTSRLRREKDPYGDKKPVQNYRSPLRRIFDKLHMGDRIFKNYYHCKTCGTEISRMRHSPKQCIRAQQKQPEKVTNV